MVTLLLALVTLRPSSAELFRSRALQEWPATVEKLRAIGETYKKWGITFKVKSTQELIAASAPLPGRMVVNGSVDSEGSLHLDIKTKIGEQHALSFETTAKFDISSEGVATKGSVSAYVGGHGLGGSIEGSRAEGYKMEAGVQESFYSVGVHFGQPDQGPLSFGLDLGPVSVEIDPTKYAKRMIEVGPQLIEKVGEKIGGVTLQVDADAMAYAIANAPTPPPEYLSSRKLVSLKSLIGGSVDSLGELNEIEGALVDSQTQDVYLVGESDPTTPAVPVERVATVERVVYEEGKFPAISIDPDLSDMSKPNAGRIDNTPDELKKSSLIETMFAADYGMKQLFLGTHRIAGFKCTTDIINERKISVVPTRFWIHPAPLEPGDIQVSESGSRRLYVIDTEPVILTAADIQPSQSQQFSPAETARSNEISEEEARELTVKFGQIEKAWPESHFSDARHNLQLTNLFSVLRSEETEPWVAKLLHDFAARAIPQQQFPLSFPALSGPRFTEDGRNYVIQGGMVTSVEQSAPVTDPDSSEISQADLAGPVGEMPSDRPLAEDPAATAAADESEQAFFSAIEGIKVLDWKRAEAESRRAVELQPNKAHMKTLHLMCLSYLDPKNFASPAFSAELAAGKAEDPKDWELPEIECRQDSYLAGVTTDPKDKVAYRKKAITAITESARLTADEPSLYRTRAALEYRLGQTDAALADWNQAIAGDKTDSLAYQQRAGYYAALGKKEECFNDLIEALRHADGGIEPLVYLVIWGQRFHEPDFSKYAIQLLSKIPISDWRVFDAMGQVSLGIPDGQPMMLLIESDFLFQKERNPAASPLDPPIYPKAYRPLDLWDDFTKRSGDRPDPSESPAGAVDFDPMLPYSIAEASFLANDFAGALQYLKAAEPYLPARKAEIEQLIATCKKKIGAPPQGR